MEEFRVITSSPRTEGDGMESSNDGIPPPGLDFEVNLMADELSSLSVASSKNTERVITLIPQTTTIPSTSNSKSTNVSQPEKKLKFVPYEPYKAAVKPIVPSKKKEKIQLIQPYSVSGFPSQQHMTSSVHQVDSASISKELDKIRKEKEELESQLKIHSRVCWNKVHLRPF